MTIAVGGVGGIFRYAAGFDMSGSTALTLNFTKPDGSTFAVTDPRVTAPALAISDPDLGALNASEYLEFITLADEFDQSGLWLVCPVYEDATPKRFPGREVSFRVLPDC